MGESPFSTAASIAGVGNSILKCLRQIFNTGQQILYVYRQFTTISAITFLRTSGNGLSPSKRSGFSDSSSVFELFIRMDTKWSDFSSSFSKPAKGEARVSTILGIARIILTQEYLQPKTCCQLPPLSCTPNKGPHLQFRELLTVSPDTAMSPMSGNPLLLVLFVGSDLLPVSSQRCACALVHNLRSTLLASSSVLQYPPLKLFLGRALDLHFSPSYSQ